MSEAPKEETGNQDDFDEAYEEFIGADESVDHQNDETDQAAEETTGQPEDKTTSDATPEQEESGQDSGAEYGGTEAEGEADGSRTASGSESEPEPEEDLEKLRQKLKSAEGRLSKFEESVAEMRERLEKSQPEPEKNPQAEDDKPNHNDGEFVPPGMDKDDWLDLQEDYPDTAKLLREKFTQEQANDRKIKEQQAREADEEKAREAFRQHILNDHPDYDTEILPKMGDLKAFIAEQVSAVQKQQYERIFEAGTAAEVSALISDYKAARGQSNPKPTDSTTATKRINDALAVPAKGGSSPNLNKGRVDMDDYDAAYEEALNADLD